MQVAVPRVAKALDAQARVLFQGVQVIHHFMDAAAGNHAVHLVHEGGAALDGLQESAPGRPDGFVPLLGVGDQHIQGAPLQAELGHVVVGFLNGGQGVAVKAQQ